MGLDALSYEDFERLARIAHRYYADGRTQEEIAREFSLSRPKVQRLLERARWSGVVDIRIATPPWLNLDLESRLRAEFRLADAIVAPRRADPQSQREAVARSAAQFLERGLHDGAVIAVGHGRDTGEVPRFFRPRRRLECEFVSAMGGSPRVATPPNPNDLIRPAVHMPLAEIMIADPCCLLIRMDSSTVGASLRLGMANGSKPCSTITRAASS